MNIASLSGRYGFVGGAAYAASKHAVLGFSRSLMLEVRTEHIRVITICPGSVNTALIRDQSMIPRDSKRLLQPEDVADSILAALQLPPRALVSEIDLRPRKVHSSAQAEALGGVSAAVDISPYIALVLLALLAAELLLRTTGKSADQTPAPATGEPGPTA